MASVVANTSLAEPVSLNHSRDFDVALSPVAQVYFDATKSLTLAEVQQKDFAPFSKRYVDFGLSDARIWLKASVQSAGPETGAWRLDLRRQYLEEGNVYLVRETGAVEVLLRTKSDDVFAERAVQNRYLAVDFSLKGGERATLYVAYTSDASTWLPMRVMSLEAYTKAHSTENRWNWTLNGALFAMLILAALFAPIIRWKVSLAFCLYLFAGILFVLHSEGYAFELLWPNQPWLYDPLDLTLILFMSLSGPLFAKFFFNTAENFPWLDRLLIAGIGCSAIFALLSFPLFEHALFKLVAYPFVVITSALHLTTGIFAYRKRLLGSLPFLIGSLLVLSSLVYASLAHARPGWISLERTLDVGHLALLADAICFAIAIVMRLLGIRRERDAALRAELAATTNQLQAEQNLRKREQEYRQTQAISERRKTQLASVRHDIRQPLISLRNAMERLGEEDEETANQIHSAFDYLEGLARQSSLQPEAASFGASAIISLRESLEQCADMFRKEAGQAGIELRLRVSDLQTDADPLILMRIVNNLLANAIRHSGATKILLACRKRAGGLSIEVWDDGSGMSDADLATYTAAQAKSETSTGSGLGLAIAQTASEAIGAQLDLTSREGFGTRSRITLSGPNS